jgi:hypothetical protein
MIEFALTVNVVIFVAVVMFLYWHGYLNFYSGLFIYVAFHFIAFVQRPIAVHAFDLRSEFIYMTYMPTEDVFLQTLLAANVGLLSFVFGYIFALGFSPLAVRFQSVVVTRCRQKITVDGVSDPAAVDPLFVLPRADHEVLSRCWNLRGHGRSQHQNGSCDRRHGVHR